MILTAGLVHSKQVLHNRCKAESAIGGPLQETIASTYAACQELNPEREAAIESGDEAALQSTR